MLICSGTNNAECAYKQINYIHGILLAAFHICKLFLWKLLHYEVAFFKQVPECFVYICKQVCTCSYQVTRKTSKYIKQMQERSLQKWQKNKMQQRTQFMKYASTRCVIIVYTSFMLSGCRSNHDVTAFDRSSSPRFTTT